MKFDPRAKLIAVILVTIALVVTTDIYIIITISIAFAAMLLRYRRLLVLMGGLRGWLFVAYFAFLVNTYARGAEFGIAMGLRLFALIVASQLFFISTKQTELVKSLRSLGLSEDYTIALSIALRFVPVVGEDAALMADALRAKKVRFHFLNKLRYRVSLLAAIIGRTMYRVSSVAETLEIKGFWQKIATQKFHAYDALLLLLAFSVFLLIVGDELGFLDIREFLYRLIEIFSSQF